MSEADLTVTLHSAISEIGEAGWDACAAPEAAHGNRPDDPFTTYRFLHALEASGSVGRGTGWEPHYLAVHKAEAPIAVAPVYAKGHSQGEYIFDHGWAEAYMRAGGRYYPKLQVAVPFTPATGRRFLTRPGYEAEGMGALVSALVQVASENGLSSAHVTFCTEAEALAGAGMGLLRRTTQQFHWENRGYADFEAFLADLASRKRKAIRKERARAQGFGGTIRHLTGDAIEPGHWDAFWQFYQDTGSRKWGRPYLTRAFFDRVHETMRDDVLLVLAERRGVPVAGALNFIGREVLFGRYWGCTEDHPFLHFECCYYQAIEAAIGMGLARVEAGAQGEHKLARGYLPSQTHSLHWVADPGFRDAIARYLSQEHEMIEQEMAILEGYGPFRRIPEEE